MKSTVERQTKYRMRMYKAGFKEKRAWVKREEVNLLKKTGINEFIRALKKETSDLSESDLSRLLNLLIKIANGRKEEIKLKKRNS